MSDVSFNAVEIIQQTEKTAQEFISYAHIS
jgi:hypothetical protein